jgi:hypothetical protein
MSETMFSSSRCEKLVAERQGYSEHHLIPHTYQRLTNPVPERTVTPHCNSFKAIMSLGRLYGQRKQRLKSE